MGILSEIFTKPEPPEPYDWPFLRERCLQAIDLRSSPTELVGSDLGDLDYDRLTASGNAAEEVVVDIVAVLTDSKMLGLSTIQRQEYLYHVAEMLRAAATAEAAVARLKEIEESIRKK